MLPVDWPVMTLRDAGVRLIDCVHKTPAPQETGLPYIGIPQMTSGRLDFESARKISLDDFLEWTKKARPQRHDVILSRRTNPGVTATDGTGTEFALGQNLVLLRSDGGWVEPAFLKWLVQSPAWWREIRKFINVGAVFDSLRCADVPDFELPIPPRTHQLGVVEFLGSIDEKIELNRRMNETLEAMARALFKSWFADFEPVQAKMADQDFGLPIEIAQLFADRLDGSEVGPRPVDWPIGTLNDLAAARKHTADPAEFNNKTPYIGLDHMPRRSIALTKWGDASDVTSGKSHFEAGDLLYGKLRPYFHKVGMAPVSGICSTDIVVIVPRFPWASAFVLATVSSDDFVAYTDRSATGTRMPRTNWKTMSRYRLCVPPEGVLRAFEDLAGPMHQQILANVRSSNALALMRDALLPKLVSGEIRVPTAERAAEKTVEMLA